MPNWKKVLVSGSNAELNQVTASFFTGDGSALTNLPSPPIVTYNSSGDNRIITSVNSSTVQGEEDLTFDGTILSGSASTTASFGRVIAADSLTIGGIEVGGHPVIADDSSTDSDHHITFVNSQGDGSSAQQLQTDSLLKYNPNSNLLSVTSSLAKKPQLTFEDTNALQFNIVTAGTERFADGFTKAANYNFHTGTDSKPFTYKPADGELLVTQIKATDVNATSSLAIKPQIIFEDTNALQFNIISAGTERFADGFTKASNTNFHTGTDSKPFTYKPADGELFVTQIQATDVNATASLAAKPQLTFEDTNGLAFNVVAAGTERFADSFTKAANTNFHTGTDSKPFTYTPDDGILSVTEIQATDVNATASLAAKPQLTFEDTNNLAFNIVTAGTERFADGFTKAANGNFHTGTQNKPITYTPGSGELFVTQIKATDVNATASLAKKPQLTFEDTNALQFNIVTAGTARFADGFTKAASGNFHTGTQNKPFTYQPSTGTVSAITFDGALSGNATTATTAGTATKVTVTNNSNTNESNVLTFVADADNNGGNVSLESNADLTFNPSTGELSATTFAGSGANLTNLPAPAVVTYDTATDNRVITSTSATGIQGEENLTFNGSTLAVTGAVTISGNLSVSGTTTTVNSTQVDIGDKIITLNAGSAAGDGGIYVNDASTAETGSLLWDVSDNRWIGGLKNNEVKLVTLDSTDTLTNKTLTAPVITSIVPTGGQTLTLPTTTDTLVGRDTTDTLTNKTLTSPVISSILNNSNTLTLPTTGDTLVGRSTTDTLHNKTLYNPVISGTLHVSSSIVFGGATADSHTTTLSVTDPTGTRGIVIPDFSGTVVLRENVETLVNKTLTAPIITTIVPDGGQILTLPTTTGTLARTSDNVASATVLETARNIGGVSFNGSQNIDLPGVNSGGNQDTSGNAATATKIDSITNSNIVQLTDVQTLTNKTLHNPVVTGTLNVTSSIVYEGATDNDFETSLTVTDPTADRTILFPDLSGTVSLIGATETLTGKTLTSPVLNVGVSGTAIKDEDNMTSDSNTHLATQQSIKAYVDAQVTAQDLDLTSDDGTIDIDLDSETLTIAGGTGINSSATSTTLTVAIDNTVTTLTGAQTLTDKTLTTPIISSISNTGTLTLPTSTDTLVGRDTSDTLTNKTLTSPDINGGTIDNATIGLTTPTTGNFTHITGSGNVSGSSTSTSSFGRFIGVGNSSIGGNLDVDGSITANEFIVSSSVTSMIIAEKSGSTIFGNSLDDTHSFTGSLILTGSFISGSADTSASFGHVVTSGNIEALGTGSFRVLNVVEQMSSQGRTFSPGYTSTDTNTFVDTNITGILNVIGSVTASGDISGSVTSTGSFGRIETTGTGSFGRVNSTNMTGTILTAAQPNITSVGTLSSIDIDGGNIDGATIATSDITVGNSKTLDVSAGALTTSATQNLNIIQGANSNIDIGGFELRAETLESDVSTGTAPFTVASTTAVTNLNADLLDGQHGSHYLDFTNITVTSGEVTNTMLQNSSVSLGGVSVSLGGTNATPAFDLQSATSYPGDSSLVTTGTVATGVWNSTFGTDAGGYISGSFSKAHLSTKIPGIVSGSEQLEDNISGSLSKVHLSSKVPNIVSGSEQIADNISGSLGPNATFLRGLTAANVSGSLGPNAVEIRTLSIAGISGSFNSVSSSIATEISNATASINSLVNNNTEDVTLVTTSHDYLSISNQAITLGSVDINDDTNLVAGTNLSFSTNTLNVDDAFLINSGNDSTSGTITAAGFITTNDVTASLGVSGSFVSTGSFGRIETAGNLVPKVHNVSDLGSSTNRWANIYSADLQLSNMDNEIGNEVDGTKGSWTIQEGEDDLYLLNRKNGKKYKFKLEEIT